MLAVATDLASIEGQVSDSFLGGNFANVALDLYRDDNDGIFEPNAGDPEVRMTMTDAGGNYTFERLTAGQYFVLQPAQTANNRVLPRRVSSLITITSDQIAGREITVIDSFNQTTQSIEDTVTDNNAETSTASAPEAIGGSRDLLVDKTQGGNNDIGTISIGVNQTNTPNLLSFDSLGFADGRRIVTWDGAGDDATVVSDGGLGVVDFTSGGDAAGLRFVIGSVTSGTAQIRLYSDDGNGATTSQVSQAELTIPALQNQPTSVEFIPFSAFLPLGGAGADLTRIGAVQLQVIGGPDYDAVADLLGTIGPTIITQNIDNAGDADLELTKQLTSGNATLNQNVTFEVSVLNRGPDITTGVVVADRLPPGITLVSNSPSTGTFNTADGNWTIPSLDVNATATLTLTGQLTSSDPQTNVAEIIAADQRDADSVHNNNVLSEDDQAAATVTAQQIDLSLDKQVLNARPNVGEQVTFRLVLANDGTDDATGIVVEDRLPAGLTLVGNTPQTGSFNTTNRRWSIPSLATGANTTLDLIVRVDQAGDFVNVAEVLSADQFDVNSSPGNNLLSENDQDDASLQTQTADLSLTKSVDNANATIGDSVTFTITVNNAGPDAATGVTVRDQLPPGLTLVGNTPSVGTFNAATGVWTLPDLSSPIGVPPTLQLVARIDTAGTKTNTATILTADQLDPDSTPGSGANTEDDTDSATVSPLTIDLQLSKGVTPARPSPGDTITYTLTLDNVGQNAATGINVQDVLPAGLSFQGATSNVNGQSAGTYSNATGIWQVPTLAATNTATLTINAILNPGRVDTLASIVNSAEVTAADQFDIDSTPGNSLAGEDDQASITITPARADLSLTKTANNLTPNVGDDVTFTITAQNQGPDVSGEFVVVDNAPSGSRYLRDTPSIGTYDSGTGRWTIPTLASGQSATLQLVVETLTSGTVTNSAEIVTATLPDLDSTPGNAIASEDDQADASVQAQQIDLSLVKSVDDETPRLGQTLVYEILVRNDGVSEATGVIVADDLPSGLTLVSAIPDRGSYNTSTRRWSIASIPSGQSATLTVRTTVNSINTLTNTAQVLAANQRDLDSIPGNNEAGEDDQSSVTVRVPVADLSLTKSASPTNPNVGDRVAFDITITNNPIAGTNTGDPATNIVVRDVLPTGLSYVSNSLTAGTFNLLAGNAGSGDWMIDSLAVGASATLTLFADVTQSGTLTNTAQVFSVDQDDPDSTAGNNQPGEDDQASDSITTPIIDLSLRKAVVPTRVPVGGEATFTLTLDNTGPDTATGVVVRDVLPTGFSLTSATPAAAYNPGTGLWTVTSLGSGQSTTLEIRGQLSDIDAVVNQAEVIAAEQFDRDSTPDSGFTDGQDDNASVTLTAASADLILTKIVDDETPNVGDTVQFTISVRNQGPDAAESIVVTEAFPIGLTLTQSSATIGVYNEGSQTWNIPALANGQTATLTLTATVDTQQTIVNSAEITASSQRDPDSTPANGSTTEDDRAEVSLSPQLVDLALDKMLDNPRPNVGETIEYVLTLRNDGPSDATGIQVSDSLPDGLTLVASNPQSGTYDRQTGRWTIPRLVAQDSVTLTLQATVQPNDINAALLANGITNVAEVIAIDQPDRDSAPGSGDDGEDDYAAVTLTLPRADLSLTKASDISNPDRDQTVRFLITVNNAGPDVATNVIVRDVLPTGLRFVDSLPTFGSYDALTGRWTIDRVEPGQPVTLELQAQVVGRDPIDNVAEIIASDQFDPDSVPGNSPTIEDDLASETITPRVVDINVVASVDNAEPLVDDVITITVTASNAAGVSDATGVVLRTGIPDGLTLLTAQPDRGDYDPVTSEWTLGALAAGQSADLIFTARVDTRGIKRQVIEVTATDQFDRDSVPANNVPTEDDETELIVRAPRLLTKRLFLSRWEP